MIINLDANWFLDCDAQNVTLTERRVVTAKAEGSKGIAPKPENIGKPRDVQHGFYGSIPQACQGYLSKGLAGLEGVLTAAQLLAAWADMTARIETACKGLSKGDKAPEQSESRNRTVAPVVLVSDGQGSTAAKGPEPLFSFPTA